MQVLGSCTLNVTAAPGQTTSTTTYSRRVAPGTQTAFGPPMSAALSSPVAGIWSATASVETFTVTSNGTVVPTGNAAAAASVTGVGRCWTAQAGQPFTIWMTAPPGTGSDTLVSVTVTRPIVP